jgi:ubiquinone/menaquinone biosynthesis C-methylase UbiE
MFTKSAAFYDALYHFKDYRLACSELHQLIQHLTLGAKTLLDVGCGTGKHLEYLQNIYKAEGLDLNPELLNIARKRCPALTFYEADMTNFNLNTSYDVIVCLFSSIAYVKTFENLKRTLQCMVQHLNTGGLIVIEPWIYPENYWIGKVTANFVDQPDLKIAWMYLSEKENSTSVFNIQYLVGTKQGVSTFNEEHVMGLWTDAEYREAFENSGIKPRYDPKGLFGRGMYYGIKQ